MQGKTGTGTEFRKGSEIRACWSWARHPPRVMKMGVALRHAARVREHSRRGDIEALEIVSLFGGERLFEPTSASPADADLGRR